MTKTKKIDKGLYGLKKGSFAEGLAAFGTKGITEPVRMTKRRREMILILIEEAKSRTSSMFEEDDEVGLDRFLSAMEYLKQQIGVNSNLHRIKLTKQIAWRLQCLVWDNKYHWLAVKEEEEFEKSTQWIMHHVNKHYSQAEVAKWSTDEKE